MKTSLFRGIIPPLLTPLLDWQTLDVQGLENLVARLLAGGVHGLFLLGTCGEGPSLDYEMRRDIIRRVTDQVAGRVPLLAAITDTSLKESLAVANYAAEAGISALVLSAPYYHPIAQNDLLKYLERIAKETPLPIFLYNMPSHTNIWFEIDTLKRAFEHPQFIGLKDSGGDMNYFYRAAQIINKRDDLTLLVGPEHLLVPSMKLGGHGGICGGAHLLPRLFVNIYNAFMAEDWEAVDQYETRLLSLGTLYNGFEEANFLGNMKCALSLLGVCSDQFAEPLHALDPSRKTIISDSLRSLGIERNTLE